MGPKTLLLPRVSLQGCGVEILPAAPSPPWKHGMSPHQPSRVGLTTPPGCSYSHFIDRVNKWRQHRADRSLGSFGEKRRKEFDVRSRTLSFFESKTCL